MAIIGGGILGTTLSYWLSVLYDSKICVIEKESDVAQHTSTRNTGVIHSPFYLDPDARKMSAISSLLSHDLWEILAKRKDLPWLPVGTIEVALEDEQHKTLEKYVKWSQKNGIPESQTLLLDKNQLRKTEPNVNAYSGLFCKRDVSTDYGVFTHELKKESESNGTRFLFNHKLIDVDDSDDVILKFENNSEIKAGFVINCSGGNSLDIAKKFGLALDYDDLHFRGEYWVAESKYANLVRRNIYTVAKYPEFTFLDPHWIKRASGKTEIGPNAVPVATPETYEGYAGQITEAISKVRQVFSGNVRKLITNRDFLRLVSKELLSSVSKTAMVHRVQQFIPQVKPDYFVMRGTAGIRTPLVTPKGEFLKDILELEGKNSFHIVNYNSPGATGAPAYSAFLIKKLQDKGLIPKQFKQKQSFWEYERIISY